MSAKRQISFPLSEGVIFRQGPWSNACLAARTAKSISAWSPSATSAMASPVAGLKTGKVLPDWAVTHFPAINIFLGLATKRWTGSINCSGRVAVFMTILLGDGTYLKWMGPASGRK